MFNNLKNKFIFLNVFSIATVMCISFVILFFFIKNYTYSGIEDTADKILGFYSTKHYAESPKIMPNDEKTAPPPLPSPLLAKIPNNIENNLFAIFSVNNENKIKLIASTVDFDNIISDSEKEILFSKTNKSGEISLDDRTWFYKKKFQDTDTKIVILQINSARKDLTYIALILLFISVILLIITYILNRCFAQKIIQPIEENFEKQKLFISDASHELKTPITIINTNLDVILSCKNETIASQEKWLQYIKTENNRMEKLVKDLLYLARIDCSDTTKLYTLINLSELVEDNLLTMEAVIYEKNIILKSNIEANIFVYGSAEQLTQVFMILLDNAIKYNDEKGIINVNLKSAGNMAKLSVYNTGKGIEPEYLKTIFNRFFRTDSSRARITGGYGLGLSIAQAIINEHNGNIYAESNYGKDSTFFVNLPLKNK